MKEESLDLIYEEEEYTDVDVEFELTLLARSVQMLSERLRRSVHIDGTFHTFRSEATTDVYVFVDSEMMEQNHVDRYHKNYKPFANRRYEADLDSLKGIMDECRTLDKYNIENAK
mgnify:CR=1 FL=1